MFCKVCFDAGKPKSEYGSHFVKDKPGKDGKVVCPHLLGLNCRYCKKPGHTIGHCDVLARKEERNAQEKKLPEHSHAPRTFQNRKKDEQPPSYVPSWWPVPVTAARAAVMTKKKREEDVARLVNKPKAKKLATDNQFGLLKDEEVPEKVSGPQTSVAKKSQLTGWAQVAATIPSVSPPPPPPPPSAAPEDDYTITHTPAKRQQFEEYGESWENEMVETIPQVRKSWTDEMEEDEESGENSGGVSGWDYESDDE